MNRLMQLCWTVWLILVVIPADAVFAQGALLSGSGKKSDEKKADIVREIVVPPRSGNTGGGESTGAGEVKQVEDVPEQYVVKQISAPEPVPALKHRLYPPRGELKPGNSVPFYYRTVLWLNNRTAEQKQEFYDFMETLDDLPFSEYVDPEIQKQADRFNYAAAVQQLETAAYREQTDWDWQMSQLKGMEPISFLLPEIQESREISRILYIRSRVEAARGNFDEALRLNLLNLKLARDVAVPPTLINDLVGVAISTMTMATVRDMICQTDCPNLYWALAALPDPFISLNEAMEYESALPEIMFPFLKDPETAVRTSDEWARLTRELAGALNELEGDFSDRTASRDLLGAGLLVRSYPIAKRELVKAGWEESQLETMPVGQVVAIYQKRVTRTLYDETIKWSYFTYEQTQRIPRLKEELERFDRKRQRMREPIPLAQLLLPSILQAKQAEARLQSKIKGLMVLEAIRMHAAEHGGQLPKSLNEIIIVPVPECPLTGEPFEYRLTENGAVLVVPTMPARPGNKKYWWEFHLNAN